MSTNLEIAARARLRPISEIASAAGLREDEFEPYGRYKGKIPLEALESRAARPDGKLVLVTAISPTPAGEGKTTTTIGLAQGLQRLGVRCIAALREPSLGPVFGQKGGAAGGGYSQVVPMDEINLHFTGDLHAITSANNLLAAVLDNHLQWGNSLNIEPRTVTWKRCLDMNDRALRNIVTGLGGRSEGVPRETGFEITAASEVMALLCLAESASDLRQRLSRIVIGTDRDGKAITAEMLKAAGPMAVLLREALKPNLAQTLEGTPAIIHGGPFANIAHGCSSVLATRMALKLGEICVTEAGFGADLGAEKFLDIKMRKSGLAPDLGVLVATIRALKMHGGVPLQDLKIENLQALRDGFPNLRCHAENLRKYGLPVVVAINRFPTDTPAEIELLIELCGEMGIRAVEADVWGQGGAGAEELARQVQAALREPAQFRTLYPNDMPLRDKIETVAREIYRAGHVEYLPAAARSLDGMQERGFGNLPVCVAKTQYSFSDNPAIKGAPTGHTLTIRDAKLSAGAGFIVVYAGTLLTMPGLPRVPAGDAMDLTDSGAVVGLF